MQNFSLRSKMRCRPDLRYLDRSTSRGHRSVKNGAKRAGKGLIGKKRCRAFICTPSWPTLTCWFECYDHFSKFETGGKKFRRRPRRPDFGANFWGNRVRFGANGGHQRSFGIKIDQMYISESQSFISRFLRFHRVSNLAKNSSLCKKATVKI